MCLESFSLQVISSYGHGGFLDEMFHFGPETKVGIVSVFVMMKGSFRLFRIIPESSPKCKTQLMAKAD